MNIQLPAPKSTQTCKGQPKVAKRHSQEHIDIKGRQSRDSRLPLTSPRIPLTQLSSNLTVPQAQSSCALQSQKGGWVQKQEVVGRGGFGKVWRVEAGGRSLALKEMSKALVIAKKSVPSVMNEKQLLEGLDSAFLVNLLQARQDRSNLYLLLDFLPGGDLRTHLGRHRFNEEEAKFILVCVLLGLRYLHGKGIIHRDIKPENIVLDSRGYARITDLGVARPWRANNSSDTSGTPGYMAPEVLSRQDHSYSVDHFALGVMAHEFMLRRRPFRGRSRKEIREEIMARQPLIRKQDIPEDWSMEAADFINKLIQRKPNQRLGHQNIEEIFRHPWLRSYPMEKISSRSVEAPWMPPLQNNCDSDCDSEEIELRDMIAENELMLRNQEVQELFKGYEFTRQNFKLL